MTTAENARQVPWLGRFLSEPVDRGAWVVGPCIYFEKFDLRRHAVTIDNSFLPRAAVKGLCVFERFPLVDASGDTAVCSANEVLANQSGYADEVAGNLVKVGPAVISADACRQTISNDCSNQDAFLHRNLTIAVLHQCCAE